MTLDGLYRWQWQITSRNGEICDIVGKEDVDEVPHY
jgi:hypothetical protein